MATGIVITTEIHRADVMGNPRVQSLSPKRHKRQDMILPQRPHGYWFIMTA
jgi:hypothetical protein